MRAVMAEQNRQNVRKRNKFELFYQARRPFFGCCILRFAGENELPLLTPARPQTAGVNRTNYWGEQQLVPQPLVIFLQFPI